MKINLFVLADLHRHVNQTWISWPAVSESSCKDFAPSRHGPYCHRQNISNKNTHIRTRQQKPPVNYYERSAHASCSPPIALEIIARPLWRQSVRLRLVSERASVWIYWLNTWRLRSGVCNTLLRSDECDDDGDDMCSGDHRLGRPDPPSQRVVVIIVCDCAAICSPCRCDASVAGSTCVWYVCECNFRSTGNCGHIH